MNFEHLCKYILQNHDKLKNKEKIKKILCYYYEILLLHRKKLKLGSIIFEFNDLNTFLLTTQLLKIKFINQDTSKSDSLKLENLIEKVSWKWTRTNCIALAISLILFLTLLKNQLKELFVETFPSLYYRFELMDELIHFSLNIVFSLNFINSNYIYFFNKQLIDLILNFVIQFNFF